MFSVTIKAWHRSVTDHRRVVRMIVRATRRRCLAMNTLVAANQPGAHILATARNGGPRELTGGLLPRCLPQK